MPLISDYIGHVVNKRKFANACLCMFLMLKFYHIVFFNLNVCLLFVGVGIDMGSLRFIHIQFTTNNYSKADLLYDSNGEKKWVALVICHLPLSIGKASL